MEILSRVTFAFLSALLMALALAVVVSGAFELFAALGQSWSAGSYALLSSIGYVVIAMAVFDVAKYFVEEQVVRRHTAPAMIQERRSLSKFLSTIVIAVFIEGLVIAFQVSKRNVEDMLYPTALLAIAIFLVLGLGVYQWLHVTTERLLDKRNNSKE